jgi:hypothetical protein
MTRDENIVPAERLHQLSASPQISESNAAAAGVERGPPRATRACRTAGTSPTPTPSKRSAMLRPTTISVDPRPERPPLDRCAPADAAAKPASPTAADHDVRRAPAALLQRDEHDGFLRREARAVPPDRDLRLTLATAACTPVDPALHLGPAPSGG